ncbi:hypothetical protein G5I_14408 [Acromyrmex echinatior]|uniref:Uncharacterized protein n=1 Tax=Acromyrmex echinatior TaxID=103372 RepID=F4X7M4_ACREC|nr:hypothetical protein G5I_14408 [Acromyrmex echinatior]
MEIEEEVKEKEEVSPLILVILVIVVLVNSGALVELLGSCSKKSNTSPTNKCLRDLLNIFHIPTVDAITTSSCLGLISNAGTKCCLSRLILLQYFWYNPLPSTPRGDVLDAKKLDKTSGTWS